MKDSTYKDTKTDKKGNYSFRLKPDFEYKIQASKFDYIDNDTTMNTLGVEESKKFRADLRLMRVPLDEIVIGDIVYDFDSDQLKPQSLSSLDSLVIFLNKASNLRISLNSHTDSRGSDAYNQDLSQRRAESVVRYLIAQGIDSARLVPAGFGESKLLNRCGNGVKCSDEEHELNRRTTFKVIGTDFRGIIKYRRVTGDLELDEDLVYTNPDWE
jgi:outer membrane protein OmpA-like peptidoglycan-associated protein